MHGLHARISKRMRTSTFHLMTTRETPADAEIASHQLMLRSGMIRKLTAGIYTWTPLGWRVLKKVERIVREEMDRAGALELLMPAVQPAELWQESGRWEHYGPELLRLKGNCLIDLARYEEALTTLEQARAAIEAGPLRLYSDYGYGPFRIMRREDSEDLGICGLFRRDGLDEPDIGFATLPACCGNGYAYEASRAVLEYARDELGIVGVEGGALFVLGGASRGLAAKGGSVFKLDPATGLYAWVGVRPDRFVGDIQAIRVDIRQNRNSPAHDDGADQEQDQIPDVGKPAT